MSLGRRLSVLAGLMLLPFGASAAEFYTCNRPDGSIEIVDRVSQLSKDCVQHEKIVVTPRPITKTRTTLDAAYEEAKKRRLAQVDLQNRRSARITEIQTRLKRIRLELANAREHAHWLKMRWSALLPGDWIPRFADPKEQERAAERLRMLEGEEATLRLELERLAEEGAPDRMPRR